jgi:glycosyltransferase involved in cell wall biosynthesis
MSPVTEDDRRSVKVRAAKVSICIPAYQRPDTVRRALRSVLAQSFGDYEVIITDDSSDDSVEQTVREFPADARIKYFKNPVRKGTPENWNESIRRAQGDHIKLLHHDDWFKDKESLGDLMNLVEKKNAPALGFCACEAYTADGTFGFVHVPARRQLARLKKDPDCLFGNNFIGSPSVTVFRKSTGLFFDTELQWAVDVDFYIRLLRQSHGFAYCDRPLVCITSGDAQQVSAQCLDNKRIEIREWLYLYRKLKRRWRFQGAFLSFLWRLIKKYDIRSPEDLVECGVELPAPGNVCFLLCLYRHLGFRIVKG